MAEVGRRVLIRQRITSPVTPSGYRAFLLGRSLTLAALAKAGSLALAVLIENGSAV